MAVLTLILAGGAGSRLSILGEKRAKPAVPFAGKYRIIDFPLSNAVNSDLYRIAVLTQFRPHSLMEHMGIGIPGTSTAVSPMAYTSGNRIAGAPIRTGTVAPRMRCIRTAVSSAISNRIPC